MEQENNRITITQINNHKGFFIVFLILCSCINSKVEKSDFIYSNYMNRSCFVKEERDGVLIDKEKLQNPLRVVHDSINDLTIEYYALGDMCLVDRFIIIEKKDELFFLPLCDELLANNLGKYSRRCVNSNTEFGAALNKFQEVNKLTNPDYFLSLVFFKGIVNLNEIKYSDKNDSIYVNRYLVDSSCKKVNYKLFDGSNAFWSFEICDKKINTKLINEKSIRYFCL